MTARDRHLAMNVDHAFWRATFSQLNPLSAHFLQHPESLIHYYRKSIMHTTRTTVLKTSLSETEAIALHRECNLVGTTRSRQARELLNRWVSDQRNSRRSNAQREGPSDNRRMAQSLPAAHRSYGVIPKMHLRV